MQNSDIQYIADDWVIANPERGVWAGNSNNFGSQGLPLSLAASLQYLNGLRAGLGLTVCVPTYSFSAFKEVPLPQSVLDLIDNDFAIARANGFKLLPHFNYCTRQGNEVAVATDASPSVMEAHLKQLKPVFEKNADVLAAGMWGMYGFWGEQWGTLNSTGRRYFEANDSTKKIFQAMIDNTPQKRMFLMRYTYTIRQLIGNEPCPETEAFTGTVRSRIGHYNDCFHRLYLPKSHETKILSIKGGIPPNMPASNYDVLLNLPDPFKSIHDRAEYSIHLANKDIWEPATGYNKLNHKNKVDPDAPGEDYKGSGFFTTSPWTKPVIL